MHYTPGMPKLKASLAIVAATLASAVHLNLPGRVGAVLVAALAAVTYVMNHDDLVALFTGPSTPPRGFVRADTLAFLVVVVWLGGIAMLAYAGHGVVATVFAVLLFAVGLARQTWRTELVGLFLAVGVIHVATGCGASALQTPAQQQQSRDLAVAICNVMHAHDAPDPLHACDHPELFADVANEIVNAAGRADAGAQ